ncbi:MAG: malonyl CoA-acyl carrier protein transacylase, partial [Pseudomonadota bacterium]|nr:malonyl CoA-acyl carrier protein transacylase [Pseudomonadota bacterium]
VEQITARVRWRESMIWLADNDAGNLVELGNGKVLATMARRIDPRLAAKALSTPDDIRTYLEETQGD